MIPLSDLVYRVRDGSFLLALLVLKEPKRAKTPVKDCPDPHFGPTSDASDPTFKKFIKLFKSWVRDAACRSKIGPWLEIWSSLR